MARKAAKIPKSYELTGSEPDWDDQYKLTDDDLKSKFGNALNWYNYNYTNRNAQDFLAKVRNDFQVVILSDTFYELALPLMEKLGNPLLLCHRLEIEKDIITGYKLRAAKAKRQAIEAFSKMGYSCIAVGDSYNDLQMFEVAEHSFFIHAPKVITEEHSSIPSLNSYTDLLRELETLK